MGLKPMPISKIPHQILRSHGVVLSSKHCLIYKYFQWRPVKVEHPPRAKNYIPSQLNNALCLELIVWRKEVSLLVLPILGCRRLTPRVEHISHTPCLFMSFLEITLSHRL